MACFAVRDHHEPPVVMHHRLVDAIAIVSSAELGKLRTFDGTNPELGAKLKIDQHPAKALLAEPGAVFLVAPRPDHRLWLVAMLFALGKRGRNGWEPHPN